MAKFECPLCRKGFDRRKKGCCPNCSEPLYYPGGRLKGQVLTQAEKEAADHCLEMLEEAISRRDGVRFEFDAPGERKERSILYQIIIRARLYLSKVPDMYGWTSASFSIDLLTDIVEGWAAAWIKSFAQINSSVARAAHELYRSRKIQEQVDRNQRSTFVELSSFVGGGAYAYHPGSGLD